MTDSTEGLDAAGTRKRWGRAAREAGEAAAALEGVGGAQDDGSQSAAPPSATPASTADDAAGSPAEAGAAAAAAGEAAPGPAGEQRKGPWRRSHVSRCAEAAAEDLAPEADKLDPPMPPLTRKGPSRPGLGCSILLRRGAWMPQLGLGGGDLVGPEGQGAVAAALGVGYRLIDTALYYRSERDIAAGIKLAGLTRSDVFIATKLLQKAHASNDQVRACLQESLRNLGTNYVDLYLIHNPRAGRIKEVWQLLLELREEGLIRSVGVSNFGVGQLEGLREAGLELPEVNQIEVHPWRQLPEVVEYHKRHGIATMCQAPLARGRMFGWSDLATLAKELNRTEAEVAIRWSLQCGYIPIPKSINPDRVVANAAQGFDLSARHMAEIQKLDSGYLSCTMASPCSELAWELVADGIPPPEAWGGDRKGRGGGGGRGGAGRGRGGYH
mmetsp:Transcript_26346/g.87309  ORF Transcript_26346/g.87309 Transcript_26346/m.87309 type:complete len:440 (+) Transcript_26346:129-1448(+)